MPAGNLEKLKYAFNYGADAVYAGVPDFSLRMRVNDFDFETLEEGIKIAHNLGKKIYITINIFAHNDKINILDKHIDFLKKNKPDAIVFSDPGIFEILKSKLKNIDFHLSTQMNVTNWRAAKFWYDLGVKRIILARELSINEIAEIHKKVPHLELEAFVHGAMCMAYSGRCMLSMFLSNRDANQGDCVQSCRWKYKVYKNVKKSKKYKSLKDDYQLEEDLRKGEFMPIEEDKNGTYIFSSRDLCMIEHLKDIWDAGVCSFKVEGRSKTENYVAHISRAYRKAIDDMVKGDKFDKKLLDDINATWHRGFFTGFYYGPPDKNCHQLEGKTSISMYDFIGIVKNYDKEKKLAEIEVRNRIEKNQNIEFVLPDITIKQKLDEMYDLYDIPIELAHGGDKNILISVKEKVEVGTIIRRLR